MRIKHILLASVFSIAIVLSFGKMPVSAGASHNMHGYAWSGLIGWISFNCTEAGTCGTSDYGVTMDLTTGNLSGYAWNDNVGWISFEPGNVSLCPLSPCQPKINLADGSFSGWARALANGRGWYGWIQLSGPTAGAPDSQGVRAISGYSWGGDVIGWIDMSGVTVGNPGDAVTVTLSAAKTTVTTNETTTLTWSSANADSCTASSSNSSWTGAKATSGSGSVTPGTVAVSYTLSCVNTTSGRTGQATVIIYVNTPTPILHMTVSPGTIPEPDPGVSVPITVTLSTDIPFTPSMSNPVYLNVAVAPPSQLYSTYRLYPVVEPFEVFLGATKLYPDQYGYKLTTALSSYTVKMKLSSPMISDPAVPPCPAIGCTIGVSAIIASMPGPVWSQASRADGVFYLIQKSVVVPPTGGTTKTPKPIYIEH